MNKIVSKTGLFLYLISTILSYSIAQDNTIPGDIAVSGYAKQYIAIKESNSFDVDNLIKEARDCYLNKKYTRSKEKYLKAISILSGSTPGTPDSLKKISYIKESLANLYTAWSQEILQEAQKEAIAGKADEAIELCNQAKEMSPSCKDFADKLIQKYSDVKNNSLHRESMADEKVNPSYKDKLYNADVLYEQGKTLFNKKLYNQAKTNSRNCFYWIRIT